MVHPPEPQEKEGGQPDLQAALGIARKWADYLSQMIQDIDEAKFKAHVRADYVQHLVATLQSMGPPEEACPECCYPSHSLDRLESALFQVLADAYEVEHNQ